MSKNQLRKIAGNVLCACALSLFALGATANAAPADQALTLEPLHPPVSAALAINAQQRHALDLLNADRAAHGLPPLRFNIALSRLAENYAQDMIKRDFFSHTSPEGLTPFERMRKHGIPFNYAGENLAFNASIRDAQQAFMDSPSHRANILNKNYTQVGIGVKEGRNGRTYVVQEFSDG